MSLKIDQTVEKDPERTFMIEVHYKGTEYKARAFLYGSKWKLIVQNTKLFKWRIKRNK